MEEVFLILNNGGDENSWFRLVSIPIIFLAFSLLINAMLLLNTSKSPKIEN